MAAKKSVQSKLTWWQWALMYPTLIVALLTALPTIYQGFQAVILNVPFWDVNDAVDQRRLWEKNYQCLQGRTFERVTTEQHVSVSALACPSGDVCVIVMAPGEAERIRWIELKGVLQSSHNSSPFVGEALAAETTDQHRIRLAQGGRLVLCQKWLPNGQLLIRVKTDDGQCFDETVDTYRGVVVKRVPARCSPDC